MSSNQPESPAAKLGKREFCRACGQFATGVAVATLLDASGAPHGMTVNSFTSVSLDPPLVSICIAHKASIWYHFRACRAFAINILREDQGELSDRFARPGEGRFDGIEWSPGASGVPVVPGVLTSIECRVLRIETAGDHDILIAEALHTVVHGGKPLVYYGSAYRKLEPRA